MILSAGPINSPQLLKLSGVGPGRRSCARMASRWCTSCRASARTCRTIWSSTSRWPPASRSRSTRHMSPARRALIGARWLLRHDGLGATNHFETGGFIRSRAGVPYPDIQFHFLPLAVSYDGSALAREHGFQAHVGPMRSKSRGRVRLRSAEPADKPRISFNYMTPRGRLDRDARLRAPDARDLRAAARSIPTAAARFSRARRSPPMHRSMPSCAPRRRAPTTPPAPAGWAA